jgi:hypothetical protein
VPPTSTPSLYAIYTSLAAPLAERHRLNALRCIHMGYHRLSTSLKQIIANFEAFASRDLVTGLNFPLANGVRHILYPFLPYHQSFFFICKLHTALLESRNTKPRASLVNRDSLGSVAARGI